MGRDFKRSGGEGARGRKRNRIHPDFTGFPLAIMKRKGPLPIEIESGLEGKGDYFAPWSIQARMMPTCSGVSGPMLALFLGGGMKSSSSPMCAAAKRSLL